MPENTIDPWTKEELLTVRHAGTIYAAAVALIAIVPRQTGLTSNDNFLQVGTAFLLMGILGAISYQLLLIQDLGSTRRGFTKMCAALVVVGALGFPVLAIGAVLR